MPDGSGRSDTDVVNDRRSRLHLERPTDYALTFDRSGWRRRKENDVETRS